MAVGDADEPAYPWNLAGTREAVGDPLERAFWYLMAEGRLKRELDKGGLGVTGDRQDVIDWHQAAMYKAAIAFAEAGRPLTASTLARGLTDPSLRSEIDQMLRGELIRG